MIGEALWEYGPSSIQATKRVGEGKPVSAI